MGQSYRDLIAWRKAMALVTQVYRATQTFPREERYGLTQPRRQTWHLSPRAESREPRAESREPRAESREPRAESREPRAESRELTAEN